VPNAGTTYQVTATFGGATYVATSTSGNEPLRVDKANSSTSLIAVTPNPIVAGDTLVLTATVTGAPFAPPDGGTVTSESARVQATSSARRR